VLVEIRHFKFSMANWRQLQFNIFVPSSPEGMVFRFQGLLRDWSILLPDCRWEVCNSMPNRYSGMRDRGDSRDSMTSDCSSSTQTIAKQAEIIGLCFKFSPRFGQGSKSRAFGMSGLRIDCC
jgi:hypothetical protein